MLVSEYKPTSFHCWGRLPKKLYGVLIFFFFLILLFAFPLTYFKVGQHPFVWCEVKWEFKIDMFHVSFIEIIHICCNLFIPSYNVVNYFVRLFGMKPEIRVDVLLFNGTMLNVRFKDCSLH